MRKVIEKEYREIRIDEITKAMARNSSYIQVAKSIFDLPFL